MTGHPRKQRSFAEIMADQKINRNILEIILTKIPKEDSTGNVTKHRNLTYDEIATFIFDTLKISHTDCLRFNYTTGRYDTREVMFKAGVDLSPYLGNYEFMEHEITTRRQRSNVTKVTFKNVPLNIPDEEIIHLCETYGKLVDSIVHYERLNNDKNRGMMGGTRFVEIELFQGASLNNFYWMEGPLHGDIGCRITVLHGGQIQQCSNCLKVATQGCPGKGNGKACAALKTPRTTMNTYMEYIKVKHGYRSLKAKYFEQYPAIGGAGNCGISDMVERTTDEEIVPINPIEEKDNQIAELKKALDESRKEVSEVTAIKDCLVKTKNELVIARKSSTLRNRKIEFAKKITEQRMSNSLSNLSSDLEEELVNLYSTLVDEDNFEVEDDRILPQDDFLKNVEEKLAIRGDIPAELERLEQVRNKILERVKQKKAGRHGRRDSISSVGSTGSKRGNGEQVGGDQSRLKFDQSSSLPLPVKTQQ